VAGVIGQSKFAYDLWGDTINTASRMESHGAPGCIQVSKETYEILRDDYRLEGPAVVEVKGKGAMDTYLLVERRALRSRPGVAVSPAEQRTL
jgi:adenylate cyclase